MRFALKALCTTAVGTGDIVGTVEIALCCGARALRIRAIPGDLTDIARTTSTLGATPWIRLPTAAALRIHHLSAYPPPSCLSTYLPITYLPIYLSTYLPIYLSTYLPIFLSTHLILSYPIHLSLTPAFLSYYFKSLMYILLSSLHQSSYFSLFAYLCTVCV